MYIKQVQLNDFRNYASQSMTLTEGLNVFEGHNASGKTNFAESIYCSALGKSPRTSKDKDLIRWGSQLARINVVVARKYRDYEIGLVINKDKKRLTIDGVPCAKMSDIVGILNVVYFSPDEMKMIKESPQERRRFIDISLCQQSKNYLFTLQKYNNVLAQRNKLLKTGLGINTLKETLFVWDMQLAKYGAYIIKKRYDFVHKLKDFAGNAHDFLTDGKEKLKISYECALPSDDIEVIANEFVLALKNSFEKDCDLNYTTFGCHRDDLDISIDNIDVRKFGSQGQQRSTALSLKFAEIDLFKDELGEKPVLLLDDVLSELDKSRRNKLLEMSASLQTIITCTEFEENTPHSLYKVNNGIITKE